MKAKRNKYNNQKPVFNGQKFDSNRELQRYKILLFLQKSGKIKDLDRQVKFLLIPTQKDEKGKLIEREVSYYADFVYTDTETGLFVVEDVKGIRTDAYIIKRKLMYLLYGVQVKEV